MTARARLESPAGFWPIDARFAWAVVAGCSLVCTHCGATGSAPLPRDGEVPYNRCLEAFLRRHKACERQEARP